MATQKGKVTIRGRFSPGTTVELHNPGSSDFYAGGSGGKVATAKTNKDGETTFSAPPGRYFAVAKEKEWNHVLERHEERVRTVDVTIADPNVNIADPSLAAGPEIGPEPPAPSFLDEAEIVVGARSSADGNAALDRTMLVSKTTGMVSEFATPVIGHETPKKDLPKSGQVPGPRIEDHRGEELASSTLTGEAVPVQPQPPKQEDAPKTRKQASATEEGVQAPAREVVRQEDFKGPQASDTETGTAFPVDPNQFTRSASGTGRTVQTGTAKPVPATREAEGRSGAKTTAKKVEDHASKANESPQAKAAAKAEGEPDTTRSRADTTSATQPAEDVRGVEHREVPEQVGTPDDAPKKSGAKKSARKRR